MSVMSEVLQNSDVRPHGHQNASVGCWQRGVTGIVSSECHTDVCRDCSSSLLDQDIRTIGHF